MKKLYIVTAFFNISQYTLFQLKHNDNQADFQAERIRSFVHLLMSKRS